MATTYTPSAAGYAERSGRGFWRRILDGMIATRERDARREIARTLAIFSDDELRNFGFTREELARWHSRATD